MTRSLTLLLLVAALVACDALSHALSDSFGRTVVELDPLGTEDPSAYALGSRFDLRTTAANARLTSSASDVLRVEPFGERAFAAEALAEGDTELEFRAEGERGRVIVQVRRVTSIDIPDALAIRGGNVRIPLHGQAPELTATLGIRNQASTTTPDAMAWTPASSGPDEIWAEVPEAEEVMVVAELATPTGTDSFPISLTTTDASAIARIEVSRSDGGAVEARAYSADDTRLLGAGFQWTVDGVDVSIDDTPGDRLLSAGGAEMREVCAEVEGQRECTAAYGSGFTAI